MSISTHRAVFIEYVLEHPRFNRERQLKKESGSEEQHSNKAQPLTDDELEDLLLSKRAPLWFGESDHHDEDEEEDDDGEEEDEGEGEGRGEDAHDGEEDELHAGERRKRDPNNPTPIEKLHSYTDGKPYIATEHGTATLETTESAPAHDDV